MVDASAVILAGGQGSRMGGTNKALLMLGGETFVERQIRVCSEWTDDIVVVCNDEAFARQLKDDRRVTVVADRLAVGQGPLAGIHAGLSGIRHAAAWVVACDQPSLDPAAATLLHERLVKQDAAAAIPLQAGWPQPLHAMYRKRAADAAEALLLRGERRMLALLDVLAWIGVTEQEFAQAGIPTAFAEDVDTPADYDRISSRFAAEDNQRR